MANHLQSARTRLVNETVQFARTMNDIEALAKSKWGKGAGKGTVNEYIDQQKLQALMEGFKSMAGALEAIHADLNAIEKKQLNQDIKLVKANQGKLRIAAPVVEDAVRETAMSSELPEWLKDIKLLDPELYTKGKRIYYSTLGLSPRDIQYNEFDLEFMNNPEFDLADLSYITKTWGGFAVKVKEYTGNTLGEFVRAYAQRRGIEFTAKKRGRKPSN